MTSRGGGENGRSKKHNRSVDDDRAEAVIAATAGRDNWQTWAGRHHGTEAFEYLDVYRGIKRTMTHSLGTRVPKSGTPCPICFCEPERSSDWHVTWCGHAVCKDCLGQHATIQVGDSEQTGPLKCPICLKTLRKQDAVVAMMAGKHNANNRDLIKQWDVKMRDQLLRAIPSFRTCPKCRGGNDDGKDDGGLHRNSVGGGFVTPECLGPQHQERREQAIQILLTRNYAYAVLFFMYLLLVGIIVGTQSPSPQLDLFAMLLPIYVFCKIGMAVNFLLARRAREALFRSIVVECPCCDESFVLPAESKQFEDEETSKWVSTNTRPCPSCSVPISKTGGCNHIRCSHCKANFCWACMRLSTSCRAYRCQNGARYGDANLFEQNDAEPAGPNGRQRRWQALYSDGSVLTYIDYILNHRVCPELRYGDGLLVLACLFARRLSLVQYFEREILSPLVVYLIHKADLLVSTFFVICLVILAIPTDWLVSLGHFLAQLFLPPERRDLRFRIENEQIERITHSFIIVFVTCLFSLPLGLSMGLGYFVNEILPLLQQQRQRRQQRQAPEQGRRGRPMPANPNRLPIDELNENMLNEALRRSIEET